MLIVPEKSAAATGATYRLESAVAVLPWLGETVAADSRVVVARHRTITQTVVHAGVERVGQLLPRTVGPTRRRAPAAVRPYRHHFTVTLLCPAVMPMTHAPETGTRKLASVSVVSVIQSGAELFWRQILESDRTRSISRQNLATT